MVNARWAALKASWTPTRTSAQLDPLPQRSKSQQEKEGNKGRNIPSHREISQGTSTHKTVPPSRGCFL